MQINVDDRGAVILGGVGAIVAAFTLAPEASMGFVEGIIDAIMGSF